MEAYRIVLADDHALFRQGMKRLIQELPDLEVAGETNDGLELLQLLNRVDTDMVLLDISMPNLRGIEATHEIKSLHPKVKVLILTMHKGKQYLYHALSAGAQGYVLKEDSDEELHCAIETVRRGRTYVTRSLTGDLLGDLSSFTKGRPPMPEGPLSPREREVLKLITEGKTNRKIAELLCISPRTVDTHRTNIMKKLGLNKTAELIRYALKNGLVELDA